MLRLKLWSITTLKALDTRPKWAHRLECVSCCFGCPLVDLSRRTSFGVPPDIILKIAFSWESRRVRNDDRVTMNRLIQTKNLRLLCGRFVYKSHQESDSDDHHQQHSSFNQSINHSEHHYPFLNLTTTPQLCSSRLSFSLSLASGKY
jgi:hypothetical protein